MHIHSYKLESQADKSYRLKFDRKLSTDAAGIATAMGLQAQANVELKEILAIVQAKISVATRFHMV